LKSDQAALAFVPHGVFPFAFAFGVFPHVAQQVFGFFHPVVATATQFFPLVRDILSWCQSMYVTVCDNVVVTPPIVL